MLILINNIPPNYTDCGTQSEDSYILNSIDITYTIIHNRNSLEGHLELKYYENTNITDILNFENLKDLIHQQIKKTFFTK